MAAPVFTRSPIAFSEWTAFHAPAAAVRAFATIAIPPAGTIRVLDAFVATLSCVAVSAEMELQIRAGATGAGTLIWQMGMNGAAGQNVRIHMNGLNLLGLAATAFTIEFLAAPAAGNFQRVNMSGFNVQV